MPTGRMERTPGRHTTRRLTEPRLFGVLRQEPAAVALVLAAAHNEAVRQFGSDCSGFHAFNPTTGASEGVWTGQGGYPRDTVVTPLAWGQIDARLAQRALEADGH